MESVLVVTTKGLPPPEAPPTPLDSEHPGPLDAKPQDLDRVASHQLHLKQERAKKKIVSNAAVQWFLNSARTRKFRGSGVWHSASSMSRSCARTSTLALTTTHPGDGRQNIGNGNAAGNVTARWCKLGASVAALFGPIRAADWHRLSAPKHDPCPSMHCPTSSVDQTRVDHASLFGPIRAADWHRFSAPKHDPCPSMHCPTSSVAQTRVDHASVKHWMAPHHQHRRERLSTLSYTMDILVEGRRAHAGCRDLQQQAAMYLDVGCLHRSQGTHSIAAGV